MTAARLWLCAVLLSLAAPARAFDDAILAGVERAGQAVARGSDEAVYGSGQSLQTLVNGGSVVYRPSLHEVQRAQVDGKSAALSDLLMEGRKQFAVAPEVPKPLLDNQILQEKLNAERRVAFDSGLDDTEMGVFRYLKGRASEGKIALNSALSDIARLVGNAFAAATLFHEAGHAGDAGIGGEGVVDGELPAFKIQYAWLTFVDPTGEKLALLRVGLAAEQKARPSRLTELALNYAKTLDVLRGTGGDDKKLRTFIKELGYQEGVGKASVAVPST